MMLKVWTMAALVGSLAASTPADAQRRDTNDSEIPKAFRPPPGMCRVWLDNVPPGQQPASTDCKSALRNKPAKARVIFGDDYVDMDKKREPSLKGFKEQGNDKKGGQGKGPKWRRP